MEVISDSCFELILCFLNWVSSHLTTTDMQTYDYYKQRTHLSLLASKFYWDFLSWARNMYWTSHWIRGVKTMFAYRSSCWFNDKMFEKCPRFMSLQIMWSRGYGYVIVNRLSTLFEDLLTLSRRVIKSSFSMYNSSCNFLFSNPSVEVFLFANVRKKWRKILISFRTREMQFINLIKLFTASRRRRLV